MTETIDSMDSSRIDTQQVVQVLVEQARSEGVELIGPGGLLTGLTKTVLETALEAAISDHLGYDKYDAAGRNGENSRNGTRSKTVFTEIGPVEIEVPRDRDGTFEPLIVKKRQRRLDGIDSRGDVADRSRFDHRGDRRALRRCVRRVGQQGHHLQDHRQGRRGAH